MSERSDEDLKLEDHICFPLYACSREVIKRYTPELQEMDLTYTQYMTMLVLWEEEKMTVKALGQRLYLDSGTLTPLLKKLEGKGLLNRRRSLEDERNLVITLTEAGLALKERARNIPNQMENCTNLDAEETAELSRILYKLLGKEQ